MRDYTKPADYWKNRITDERSGFSNANQSQNSEQPKEESESKERSLNSHNASLGKRKDRGYTIPEGGFAAELEESRESKRFKAVSTKKSETKVLEFTERLAKNVEQLQQSQNLQREVQEMIIRDKLKENSEKSQSVWSEYRPVIGEHTAALAQQQRGFSIGQHRTK